jgi:hypothetical protein
MPDNALENLEIIVEDYFIKPIKAKDRELLIPLGP